MAQNPLHLLCIEPRFPGRLGAVADWLVRRRGYRCQFFFHRAEPREQWPESVGKGLELVQFNVGGAARESAVTWTRCLERGLSYAYGCWEVMESRRPRPVDVVLGRSAGLGSTLFAPVFAPRIPIVNLFDYFYHPHTHDLADEAPEKTPAEYFHWRQAANAMDFLDLENGITPWTLTPWQRDLYPAEYRKDFTVLFDGVNLQRFHPKPRTARVVAGRSIPSETKVVTFVARCTDRLRGFDRFLELANRLLRSRPDVLCIVAGGASVERGLDVQFFNQDYPRHLFEKTPPHDPERFWSLGSVSQTVVAEVLAASDLHVYPSRPYPVSRSLMEAMASGCVVLASESDPVREFITSGQNGILVPPNEPDSWEAQAHKILDDLPAYRPLGEAATALIQTHFSQDVTLPALDLLLNHLVEGRK